MVGIARQTFTFSRRTALGVEARRRLHGDKAQQLHHVVLHHVAQRAGLLVKRPAAFHAQRLRRRNLHVIDVVPIPDRLEDSVGEPEHQNVLHRLLAQIVVDAEDLVLVEDRVHLVIQLARRIQIVAERLLNHHRHACPCSGCAMPCAPRFSTIGAKYSGAVAR